jgi:hypothetical protein
MNVRWPSNKRLAWLLASLLLMFGSALALLRWASIGFVVGDWIGLPQSAGQIPRLETEGGWCLCTGVVLPFLAAIFLGFGKRTDVGHANDDGSMPADQTPVSYLDDSLDLLAPIATYLLRLIISAAGTFGFAVLLLLVIYISHPR